MAQLVDGGHKAKANALMSAAGTSAGGPAWCHSCSHQGVWRLSAAAHSPGGPAHTRGVCGGELPPPAFHR